MRKNWSDEELAASLRAYRAMAVREAAGDKYSKKQVYRELAQKFGRSEKSFEFRMQNISAVLGELGLPWISGLKPKGNVGGGVKPRLIALIEQDRSGANDGPYKHGNKRTWELALEAVANGATSAKDVLRSVVERNRDYNENNLGYDLALLSVNSASRTAYSQNSKPRRTDQRSEFDRLFKIGDGRGASYELYDPSQHGVWEIFPDPAAGNRYGMGVRRVVDPIAVALVDAAQRAETGGAFVAENVEDARKRVLGAIVRRQGQPAFRKALLEAYGGACALTGCTLVAILEAAHIHPYKGNHTNVVSNGLLLRADIHTLFDLRLITIDPASLTVLVAPELEGTEYVGLRGRALRRVTRAAQRVSVDALTWHRSGCGW